MKRAWLVVAVAAIALGVQGCVFISGEHRDPPGPPERYGADPQDPTVAEIRAVGKLTFDQDRQVAYRRIAGREGISEGAQVYLVAVVFRHLSFEQAKMDVLLTLVNNRSFAPDAKSAILERLDGLTFEQDKVRMFNAMADRPPRPAGEQAVLP